MLAKREIFEEHHDMFRESVKKFIQKACGSIS